MGCGGIQPRETDCVGRAWCGRGLRDRHPATTRPTAEKPSAWRKGTRKTRRSVNAVSIAQSETVFGAPGRPDGAGRHASVASAESHSVTSPRWTKACSYADHFPTRYFVLYFGWTFDLMSRSCTRSGHRGQRAYSCLVAAEGLCTNAAARDAGYRWIGIEDERAFRVLVLEDAVRMVFEHPWYIVVLLRIINRPVARTRSG